MTTIKSLDDLKKIKEEVSVQNGLRDGKSQTGQLVQIKVGMATCGIASGAKEVMNFLSEEVERQAIDANIMQTGCLGYCYAEPTVEVRLPGKESVIFGYVNKTKAQEIIDNYIIRGEKVDGVIDINFKTIDE